MSCWICGLVSFVCHIEGIGHLKPGRSLLVLLGVIPNWQLLDGYVLILGWHHLCWVVHISVAGWHCDKCAVQVLLQWLDGKFGLETSGYQTRTVLLTGVNVSKLRLNICAFRHISEENFDLKRHWVNISGKTISWCLLCLRCISGWIDTLENTYIHNCIYVEGLFITGTDFSVPRSQILVSLGSVLWVWGTHLP